MAVLIEARPSMETQVIPPDPIKPGGMSRGEQIKKGIYPPTLVTPKPYCSVVIKDKGEVIYKERNQDGILLTDLTKPDCYSKGAGLRNMNSYNHPSPPGKTYPNVPHEPKPYCTIVMAGIDEIIYILRKENGEELERYS